MRRTTLLIDEDRAAEIAALEIALEEVATKAKKLAEYDIHAFGEVYVRAKLAHRTMQTASKRHQHKAENGHKMALVEELSALRRRRI